MEHSPQIITSVIVITLLGLCTDVLADCFSLQPLSPVTRLREHLLCDYDKSVRPVAHHDTVTKVSAALVISTIDYIDYREVLEVDSLLSMSWQDDHLKWNPEDFLGLRHLMIKTDVIWTPDIVLLNADYDVVEEPLQFRACLASSNGYVSCIHHSLFSALCVSDFRRWPFDSKNCSLELGSLKYTVREVVLSPYSILQARFTEPKEWKVTDYTSDTINSQNVCCDNETYSLAVYKFFIQRYYARHLAVIIAPILVFAMMTLCTFCIHPLRQERLVLCCWNILSHFLFMHYVMSLGAGNHAYGTPYVVLYFRDSLVMAVASLVFTIIGRRYSMRTTAPYSFLVRAATSVNQLMKIRSTIPFNFKIVHTRLASSSEEGSSENDEISMLVDGSTAREETSWRLVVQLMDIVLLAIFLLIYFIFILALLT